MNYRTEVTVLCVRFDVLLGSAELGECKQTQCSYVSTFLRGFSCEELCGYASLWSCGMSDPHSS